MSTAMDSSKIPQLQASFPMTPEAGSLLHSVFSIPEVFEPSLVVVNDLVFAKRGKYLNEAELIVIRGALNNLDYEQIADNSAYALNYLQRCVAPLLWDLLSETIGNGQRVTKKKLPHILEQLNEKYHIQSAVKQEQNFPLINTPHSPLIIRGQLPQLSKFYGRIQELAHLKKLIVEHPCIAIVGIAGVGKTVLAAKLMTELSQKSPLKFEGFVWKTVSHSPLLSELVFDLITLTKGSQEPELSLPGSTHGMISVLIQQLQSRPYFLILDGVEALFQRNSFTQRLEYGVFLNRLIDEASPSRFLLTTRILPDELHILVKNKPLSITAFKLEGLDIKAAKQLLFDLGLTEEDNYQELIKTYCGNPLELKTVVERIERFFAGSINKFLEKKTTLISLELQKLLDEMFGQVLNDIQRQIMICIAEQLVLNSQPLTFTKLLMGLNQNSILSVSTSELITSLEKLERLSLIESGKDPLTKEITFTLQPSVKKYIRTDPTGLVRTYENLPKLPIAS